MAQNRGLLPYEWSVKGGRITRIVQGIPSQVAYCYLPNDIRLVALAENIRRQQRHTAAMPLADIEDGDEQLLAILTKDDGVMAADVPQQMTMIPDAQAQLSGIHINGDRVQLSLMPTLIPHKVEDDEKIEQVVQAHIVEEPEKRPRLLDRSKLTDEINYLANQFARKNRQPVTHVFSALNKKQAVRSQTACTDSQLQTRLKIIRQWLK